MLIQKVYLLPKNLGQLKKSRYSFRTFCFIDFDWYLFHLVVRLNPGFSYCNSFALSWVDEVTTET